MPFDSAPQQADDLLTFTPGREGLRKLATLLRMQMPPMFTWDYNKSLTEGDCGTKGCAYGLARTVWPCSVPAIEHTSRVVDAMASAFAMSPEDSRAIFFDGATYGRGSGYWSMVTPSEVAAAIDAYLARTS